MSLETENLTTPEAAQYLRTTVGALQMQRLRGMEPGTLGILVGRRLIFRRSDLDAWLDEQLAAQRSAREAVMR